jgi:hypothetical protein
MTSQDASCKQLDISFFETAEFTVLSIRGALPIELLHRWQY